jgi:hypothetical protein
MEIMRVASPRGAWAIVTRRRFERDLVPLAQTLGAWSKTPAALYDEFYAHLVGDALPAAISRFAACFARAPYVPPAAKPLAQAWKPYGCSWKRIFLALLCN